jgi:hypothetical protein
MKKQFLLLFALLMAGITIMAQGSTAFFTNANTFFSTHISGGGVDYDAIKADPTELNSLVSEVAKFPYSSSDAKTQKAFLLNAYNILVIKNVIDHYPIAKPTDVKGFFDEQKFTVAGQTVTLSDIENKKIRPTFKDARVHFALVCAAKSCPPIANYAFTPTNVEAKLEALTKAALNSKSFIKVDDQAKTVQFSMILDWYKEDFVAKYKTVLDYVNNYRETKIPASYTQSFYEYNWALNKKK